MFTDKNTAKKINNIMLEVSELLNQSVVVMNESECTNNEKQNYIKLVGKLMAVIGLDILNEIYRKHRELKPEEYYLPEN